MHTFLVYKKGEKSDPLNYRGIALVNSNFYVNYLQSARRVL